MDCARTSASGMPLRSALIPKYTEPSYEVRPTAIAWPRTADARDVLPAEVAEYERHVSRRLLVKPGITGWAQVNGLRGETAQVERMAERIEYDLDYIRNWSPWLDIKIIVLTVWTVLRGDDNAY